MSIRNTVLRKSESCKDEKKNRQGYIDLKKATTVELEELIERQDKLLRNRAFIYKLPDKGTKIQLFREKLQSELTRRQKLFNTTCNLLSNLNLNDSELGDLEWNNGKVHLSNANIDSDDEEEYFSASENDPLKILATHSGTDLSFKKNINTVPSDLSNEKFSYARKMCKKYDSTVQPKERFKPNQLKDNNRDLIDTSAEKLKKRLGDKWEVTEATPPIFTLKNTKAITLSESIQLQKEHAEKLRETEKKHAAEKLLLNINIKMGEKLPSKNIEIYRSSNNDFNDSINEEEEETEERSSSDGD